MSDSDDDYMSDKLLTTCKTRDVRPGLLFNKTQKRTHELHKKQIEGGTKKTKTYHEQEKELREKGLNTAISSENVGFKLLQKMGYKEGNSLGRHDMGIKEPVNIVLKSNTSGVGREKHVDDIVKKKSSLKEQNLKDCEEEFLAARHEKTVKLLLRKDFFKSQRICEDLDTRQGIEKPVHDLFWTKDTMKKLEDNSSSDSDSDDQEEVITEENLRLILDYLREEYLYCLYCGIKAMDKEDLLASCPGPYRVNHTDEIIE